MFFNSHLQKGREMGHSVRDLLTTACAGTGWFLRLGEEPERAHVGYPGGRGALRTVHHALDIFKRALHRGRARRKLKKKRENSFD